MQAISSTLSALSALRNTKGAPSLKNQHEATRNENKATAELIR